MSEMELAYAKHVRASFKQRVRTIAYFLSNATRVCECTDCVTWRQVKEGV